MDIKFQYQQDGFLGHGSYYAAHSFLDPRSFRRILYGWIPEEDIILDHARRKGWNGSLAIPRELFLLTIAYVVKALHSELADMSCFGIDEQLDGSTTLHTLGIKPISEVAHWRSSSRLFQQTSSQLLLPQSGHKQRQWLFPTSFPTWELEATISLISACETVGFFLRHRRDLSICCTITFSAQAEAITVEREA